MTDLCLGPGSGELDLDLLRLAFSCESTEEVRDDDDTPSNDTELDLPFDLVGSGGTKSRRGDCDLDVVLFLEEVDGPLIELLPEVVRFLGFVCLSGDSNSRDVLFAVSDPDASELVSEKAAFGVFFFFTCLSVRFFQE